MQKIVYSIMIIIFIIVLIIAFATVNDQILEPIDTISGENVSFENEATLEEIIPYLKDAEYEEKVVNYQGKVFIDYYTDWCYYCKIFSPTIEEVSKEKNDIKFYRVNAEEELDIASKNRITFYPTIILYENGIETNRFSGVLTKEELIDFISGDVFEEE